jgi:hypothetical protein
VLKSLAGLPAQSNRREDTRRRLHDLGRDAGLSDAILTSLLDA